MNRVRVRKIVIGEGKPKIIVPIVAKTEEEIEEQVQKILHQKADILEWRGDWFDGIFDWERVKDALHRLRKSAGEIPVLFTFRTAGEGGEKEVSQEIYRELNINIAKTQLADMIDIEGFVFENADRLIKELKEQGMFLKDLKNMIPDIIRLKEQKMAQAKEINEVTVSRAEVVQDQKREQVQALLGQAFQNILHKTTKY